MGARAQEWTAEHLTPHDLVTYSRCPHELELMQAHRATALSGQVVLPRTPLSAAPRLHSPLVPPPLNGGRVAEGRLDILESDLLVYWDQAEQGLPVLFPPESVRFDLRFGRPGATLVDREFGLSGRPDLVIRHDDGSLTPIEYKSTHLFVGYHEVHGRLFDAIQAVAECRLVEAVTGARPATGLVLYGDVAGNGAREGWVEIRYGDLEASWLRAALEQIRTDSERLPVPTERTCPTCPANRDRWCAYASPAMVQVASSAGHRPLEVPR